MNFRAWLKSTEILVAAGSSSGRTSNSGQVFGTCVLQVIPEKSRQTMNGHGDSSVGLLSVQRVFDFCPGRIARPRGRLGGRGKWWSQFGRLLNILAIGALTIIRADFQSAHTFRTHTRKIRSAGVSFSRLGAERRNTAS